MKRAGLITETKSYNTAIGSFRTILTGAACDHAKWIKRGKELLND
jgi:hypothetical protein